MMALSNLQRERIKYHLDQAFGSTFELVSSYRLSGLSEESELFVVGAAYPPTDPQGYPQLSEMVTVENLPLATRTSLLGQVELAFAKLGPETLDDSLLVAKVGGIELRGSEEAKRIQLYLNTVNRLSQALGGETLTADRVGW